MVDDKVIVLDECTTRTIVPYSGSSEDEHDADAPPNTIECRIPPMLSKRAISKAYHTFGVGRAVQDIPCKPRCQHHCGSHFSISQRHEIHEFYWGLGNYARQRNWLLTCVEQIPIRRRRQRASMSRRQHAWNYFINWNNERVQVCQQFLLSTLNISQMTIRYAIGNAVQQFAKPDERGRHAPSNKTPLDITQAVHRFIKQLPAFPLHSCCNTNTRRYLPGDLRNVSFLYRLFVGQQEDTQSTHIKPSLQVFREIFRRDFNLGFHQPKMDKCRACECRKDNIFHETDPSKVAFAAHLLMKDEGKGLFLVDQNRRRISNTCVRETKAEDSQSDIE